MSGEISTTELVSAYIYSCTHTLVYKNVYLWNRPKMKKLYLVSVLYEATVPCFVTNFDIRCEGFCLSTGLSQYQRTSKKIDVQSERDVAHSEKSARAGQS